MFLKVQSYAHVKAQYIENKQEMWLIKINEYP